MASLLISWHLARQMKISGKLFDNQIFISVAKTHVFLVQNKWHLDAKEENQTEF